MRAPGRERLTESCVDQNGGAASPVSRMRLTQDGRVRLLHIRRRLIDVGGHRRTAERTHGHESHEAAQRDQTAENGGDLMEAHTAEQTNERTKTRKSVGGTRGVCMGSLRSPSICLRYVVRTTMMAMILRVATHKAIDRSRRTVSRLLVEHDRFPEAHALRLVRCCRSVA